jgi:hypothetical protein
MNLNDILTSSALCDPEASLSHGHDCLLVDEPQIVVATRWKVDELH